MSLKYARGDTKASMMARSYISQENFFKTHSAFQDKEAFKLSKFKKAKARINTNLAAK